MTDPLPSPLVPAEVDLRDFAFMPLDVQRLRDSDLTSDETPESCWAAVLLWCASWHQVPAASIPDSDQWQAKVAGYVSRGRIDSQWAKVKPGALRGWIACEDGRLYHPVVAEKALDAWRSKLLQRWKTEAARVKKHNQRHELTGIAAVQMLDFEDWMQVGCPQGHALPVPGDKRPMSPGSPHENQSKGQGEGQGQGEVKEKKAKTAAAPPLVAGSTEPAEGLSDCPHEAIIAAFHEALPTARRVRDWTPARAQVLRTRWREDRKRQNLGWWQRFFAYCGRSDFLTGKAATPGRRPFELSLDWLVKSENFAKVREGAFHDAVQQGEPASIEPATEPA